MNNNNGFGLNNNSNVGENNNDMTNDTMTYDSYYNHKPRKTPWIMVVIIIVVIILMLASLWLAGAFTPMDRQAEYNKLYSRVCAASLSYANTKHAAAKEVSGKIVYVTVGNLIDANLIEASLRNYLTNEPIPASTDVRLEVLPSGEFQCHGFAWPGDDTVKPVIKLKGDAVIYSNVGQQVKDPGATATDDKDGDISDKISRSGSIDIYTRGTYVISYTVRDRAGNLSNIVKRTYIVQ